MNIPNKKPFGLTLSAKIAAQALHDSVAPNSIVLGNLLLLQKDINFPKNLDTHFFSFQKNILSDNEKKNISIMLTELKKPNLNIAITLEHFIAPNWVTKKSPSKLEVLKKNPAKLINKKPFVSKKDVAQPVIIVKKPKLT